MTPAINTVWSIRPRWRFGVWVFDDERFELVAEPFVGDTNRIVDLAITQAGDSPASQIKEAKFTLSFVFDAPAPPSFNAVVCQKTATEGSWTLYRVVGHGIEGWLCPALFHYTEKAPERIDVWVTLDA